MLIILDDYIDYMWVRFLLERDSIKKIITDFIRRENKRKKFKYYDRVKVFVKVQRLRLNRAKENLYGKIQDLY